MMPKMCRPLWSHLARWPASRLLFGFGQLANGLEVAGIIGGAGEAGMAKDT